jgi:hypothetical protein
VVKNKKAAIMDCLPKTRVEQISIMIALTKRAMTSYPSDLNDMLLTQIEKLKKEIQRIRGKK